jgi:hypothetical protein
VVDGKKTFHNAAIAAVVFLVRVYQVGKQFFLPPSCRFYPTCSAYAIDALRKYGLVRGSWKALKRLGRCHPLHPGGYDPA